MITLTKLPNSDKVEQLLSIVVEEHPDYLPETYVGKTEPKGKGWEHIQGYCKESRQRYDHWENHIHSSHNKKLRYELTTTDEFKYLMERYKNIFNDSGWGVIQRLNSFFQAFLNTKGYSASTQQSAVWIVENNMTDMFFEYCIQRQERKDYISKCANMSDVELMNHIHDNYEYDENLAELHKAGKLRGFFNKLLKNK